MNSRCLINTLEDALLEQIFGGVCFDERLMVLPRVSKRWARILEQPSTAWQEADIDLHSLHNRYGQREDGLPLLDARVISAWFGRRANCMRVLELEDSVLDATMPAAITTTIIASQCGSLQRLAIMPPDVGLAGQNIAALAVLSQLTCLEVILYNILFEDRGAMLLRTVQHLPSLVTLDVNYHGRLDMLAAPVGDNHGLPRCKELASLHSRSLTRLCVSMLDGPEEGNVLRLGGLPELQSLALVGDPDMPQMHLRIDAASFDGAPKLHDLRIEGDETMQLQHGSFEQLTGLTELALVGCGLRTVPAAVPSFSATLCVLTLDENDHLQLDDAAVASILQCGRLQRLSLHKEELVDWKDRNGCDSNRTREGYAPVPWSLESVSHLLQLPSAFCERHGRHLCICITESTWQVR